MNAGGYRVSPHEVEAALAQCPGVAEVACTEVRVRSDVSVIAAFVVQTGGIDARCGDDQGFRGRAPRCLQSAARDLLR